MLLKPDLSQLPTPFILHDMEKAVTRTVDAILNHEKIAVYGDYDVDGTCGASLLIDFFSQLGVTVSVYQPNRFTEGYGVHTAAIEKLILEDGARVVITVDCGITATLPAERAKELNRDLIILDHHQPGPKLPDAFAIVDPKKSEDTSNLKNLCGAALAFFFAAGLRIKLRESGFFSKENRPEPNLLRLLDLVATATIADVVDVRGINRILVSYGLKVMEKNPRPGIKAILQAAGIEKPQSTHCGFIIGPRINAAGRLKSAHAAFRLLTSNSFEDAQTLALELEKLNQDRRKTQEGVHQLARKQALEQIGNEYWNNLKGKIPAAEFGPWPRALVLAPEKGAEPWHEGVVGIVASKIVEEFGRPAFVLTEHGDVLKGSIRSLPKIDILSAVSQDRVARHLKNFGGHAHAGGLSLSRDFLTPFIEDLNEYLAISHTEASYRKEPYFDLDVDLREITPKLLSELEVLEPYGQGFPEPVFRVNAPEITTWTILKEKHLKFKMNKKFDAVWFNAIKPQNEYATKKVDHTFFWFTPQWNEWQGSKKLQLRITHAE